MPAKSKAKVTTKSTAASAARPLTLSLGQRTILAEGRLAGFREYDPDAAEVVTGLLGPLSKAMQGRIAREAAALGAFIRDELSGNAKCFSLDTEEELRRRSRWVRGLGETRAERGGAPPSSRPKKAAKK